MRQRLQATADDLGATGWDTLYGYGLVDADEAVLGSITPTNNPPVADAGGPYTGTVGISVSFDGYGSSDADNDPLTHSWDFGDYETGTGVSPTHAYTAAGVYTITLVVNDGIDNSEAVTTTATISDVAEAGTMHVGNIDVTYKFKQAGKNTFYSGVAEVIVVDANGTSLEGVTVYGHWSDVTGDNDSGITDPFGMVTLTSDSVKNATGTITFTFTVDNLVISGWDYEAADNAETSDSRTIIVP